MSTKFKYKVQIRQMSRELELVRTLTIVNVVIEKLIKISIQNPSTSTIDEQRRAVIQNPSTMGIVQMSKDRTVLVTIYCTVL